ncbi:transposase family protein [Streptomyces sp. NPDC058086]|uniref:transposase family protein n=1 Tax=Streptomyces sp. NPDC058086 TaxID=3346334 RepID=UPI0036E4F4CA
MSRVRVQRQSPTRTEADRCRYPATAPTGDRLPPHPRRRLLAAVLHYRHGLPQIAIAALFNVRPETINRRLRDIRELLATAGHDLHSAERQLATLNDLFNQAREAGIITTLEINTAS